MTRVATRDTPDATGPRALQCCICSPRRKEHIVVIPGDDSRRTDVATLLDLVSGDRALSTRARGGLPGNAAFEHRGDLVAKGAGVGATVVECRERAWATAPRLVGLLGSRPLVGGCP